MYLLYMISLHWLFNKPRASLLIICYTLITSPKDHCMEHSTLYSVWHTLHCTLYTVHCTLYSVHCIVYDILYTV